MRQELAVWGLIGAAEAVPVPERRLKSFEGLVATSDGELIEACPEPIDLAGLIIRDEIKEARIVVFED